jgi:Flp pilus assembly protein TadG
MAAVRTPRRGLRSERGAEIIELVMVTPILLLILGAIVDFGFLFRTWEVVTNAAREGARVGVLPNHSCSDDPAGDVELRVADYLTAAGLSGATVDVAEQTVAGFTSCNVRVTISQPLPSLGVFGLIVGGSYTNVQVAGGASMRTEVQGP